MSIFCVRGAMGRLEVDGDEDMEIAGHMEIERERKYQTEHWIKKTALSEGTAL